MTDATDESRAPAPEPKCELLPPENVAATLTIHDAGRMTPEGREEIADWLRRQADMLAVVGADYGKRFQARYVY